MSWSVRFRLQDRLDDLRALASPRRHEVLFQGPPGEGRRLCFFAHYDAQGSLSAWTRHYLDHLRANGLRIVFVTTGPRPDEASLAFLRSCCEVVVVRPNVGHDFGSWALALRLVGPPPPDGELLFCNDSVLGPFFDLGPTLDRFRSSATSVWGLTDNHEHGHHLQSYFLWMRGHALQAPALRRFWSRILLKKVKHAIVVRYEVGFSRAAERAGLAWEAAWKATAKTNLLHQGWRGLLDDRFPFVKKELVERNPLDVPDVHEWAHVLLRKRDLLPQARRLLEVEVRARADPPAAVGAP